MAAARWVRAWWRLTACLFQVAGGLLICSLVFPFLDPAQRLEQIGRWSRRMLRALGIVLHASGAPPADGVLVVSNHVSWLDILVINAVCPVRFVSKADVRAWPVLGWLVASAGTLFIERERKRDALRVVQLMADALRRGERVAVFPEGTTSSGHGLLPFHANLLQAAITSGMPVQAVVLRYADAHAPISRAAAYINQQTLAHSLWTVLNTSKLQARLHALPPQDPQPLDRRTLGRQLQERIAAALDRHLA